MPFPGQYSEFVPRHQRGKVTQEKPQTPLEIIKEFVEKGHEFDAPDDTEHWDMIRCTKCVTIVNNWMSLGKFKCPPQPVEQNPFVKFQGK